MARALQPGDTVYVPCSCVSGMENTGVALYRTTVAEVSGKKAQVNLPNGRVEWVGSGLLHKDVGILIINIGDLETEHTLLDPLAKSIAQFCRLLVPDDQIRSIRVRSMAELQKFWSKNQEAYSHVVWIGHGSETGITFAVDGLKDAAAFVTDLRIYGASKKTYISLCCKTGYQSFGAPVSEAPICKYFIGPFHSVEGAVASQFCQTFLTSHFLNGKSAGVAFKHARESVPGSASFRLWNSGKLKAGPRK